MAGGDCATLNDYEAKADEEAMFVWIFEALFEYCKLSVQDRLGPDA